MEESREGAHGNRLSEEFQDENGLELCLGLGLSSADSRQKWKTAEESALRSSSPSVDQTGELSAAGTLNGAHPFCKPKPSTKSSGLEAALKRFLEGSLDEQDESNKLLDGSLNPQKDKDKLSSVGLEDKPGHQANLGLDMDNKGKPFLFKELQVSSGQKTSGGPSPAGMSPFHLVDVFKIGSNSSSPHSVEGIGLVDGDDGGQERLEQHKKLEDVGKKRKHLIEEQKHQKMGKKDDKPGTHGFCRPDSNTWVSAPALDMDKTLLGLRGDDANGQIQGELSQESDGRVKGYETDGNESTGFDKKSIVKMNPNDSRGTGDDSKGVKVNFMPQFRAPETGKKLLGQGEEDPWSLTMNSHVAATIVQSQCREVSLKGAPPNNQKHGQVSPLTIRRETEKAGSALHKQIEKVPSETSSGSTDGTEKLEDKGRGGGVGEASSTAAEVLGSDKVASASAATRFLPPAAMTNSAAHPYPLSPYSVIPMPYPLSGSMPHAPGMPFPAGLNSPYAMQYMASDGSEHNGMRPVGSSSFQTPSGIEYPSPQLSSLEGISWMQALRPPGTYRFTGASNGVLHSRNAIGLADDANNRLQVTRAHDNGNGDTSPAGDISFQNHPLFRAVVHNSSQDSQQHQGPDAALLSPLQIPAVPHFSSQLAIADHGEFRVLKEQGGMPSFPRPAAQSLPGGSARPPCSSGTNDDGGQEQAKFGGKAELTHSRNVAEPSHLSQEEFQKATGVHSHQGSTDNLSFGDGLGAEDLAHLQRGIAPGLKFGGSGLPPDLPWVYTTGPNGRAVGGVLYRLSQTQLRVVCACHGKHMSPAEFHQHAGDGDTGNVEKNLVVNLSPLPSQAT